MCPHHILYAAFFIIRRHRGSSVSLKFWVLLVFFTLHLCHWTYFNSTKHLRILKFLIIYWLGMHLSGWQCYTVSGIFLWLFWAGTDGEGGCGLVVTKLQLGRDVWVLQLSNVEFTEHPVHEITSLMKNLFYGLFHDQCWCVTIAPVLLPGFDTFQGQKQCSVMTLGVLLRFQD